MLTPLFAISCEPELQVFPGKLRRGAGQGPGVPPPAAVACGAEPVKTGFIPVAVPSLADVCIICGVPAVPLTMPVGRGIVPIMTGEPDRTGVNVCRMVMTGETVTIVAVGAGDATVSSSPLSWWSVI